MGHARIGKVRMNAGGAEIVPLRLVSVGEGYRFDPDAILSEAMGQGFVNLVVVAEFADGEIWLSSAANAGESLILLERAKQQIIEG